MIPCVAHLEGEETTRKVFMIRHQELTAEQIDKILTKLSTKFNAPKEVIKQDMLKHGLPLRYELTNGSGTNDMGLFI